ncbi:unnamed protein product [Cylicostephanus goldi]|uniref:Uncharacterized protein n=1 Tax=Cylicostephanus goldi TaxID=71465 RepID=A0A3P7NBU3_CYLGO|nr:unnamed protein product [Cylicostephanus goldi]
MRGSIAENKRLMKNEEGDEAVLHWEIRRTSTNGSQELIHKVATKFRVVPDSIYALVPVAKVRNSRESIFFCKIMQYISMSSFVSFNKSSKGALIRTTYVYLHFLCFHKI